MAYSGGLPGKITTLLAHRCELASRQKTDPDDANAHPG
jgi:hypothetical protein